MMVLGAASAATSTERSRSQALACSLAGPALIVGLVVVVLHDVVLGGMVSDRNPDLLAFWMPNQCLLGQELTAGRIPYWNPHALAGTPFAADPQSGWMYLPMMALSVIPCDVALPALIAFFPILAGLGGYAFLRAEGASRMAATISGLTLAGVTSGSALAVTLTFVGFVAWSPWLLAAASRALSATTWPSRLVWATATALVWGQLAAAHISNGLVMGSVLLGMFWVYRTAREVRAGRLRARAAVTMTVLVLVLLVLVNLAYLLPRVLYLQRSTIGLGYEGLFELRDELWGKSSNGPPTVRVTEPQWIFRLGTSPGAYLAALPLALSFAALFVRRWRGLAVVLWIYVLGFYAIGTRGVAEVLQPLIGDTFLGDFYGHAPARFGYAPVLGLCLLAGLGTQAMAEQASTARRVWLLIPGVLLWGLGPLLAGVDPARMWLIATGAAVSLAVAALGSVVLRRPRVTWGVLAAAVAFELGVNGLLGQSGTWERASHGLTDPRIVGVEPLPEPDVDPSLFASELPTLGGLQEPPEERWMTIQPSLQILGRQIVHGLNEAQGYNPVQLRRYWTYTRAVDQRGVDPRPRLTVFKEVPQPGVLAMFGVRYVATASASAPEEGYEKVAAADGWTVWEVPHAGASAASVYGVSMKVASPERALEEVTDPRFDGGQYVILERSGPSIPMAYSNVAPAALRWLNASEVEVRLDRPDLEDYLLVRIPFDDYWTAEVDGDPAEVEPANYFLQAVEVSRGDRVVRLAYRDPWVVWGSWGSAAALATVVAAAAILGRRRQIVPTDRPREAETSSLP